MAEVDPLWVAGITAGASFLSAALASVSTIVTTTIANRHSARVRLDELNAAAAERASAAAEAQKSAYREQLRAAHLTFSSALQRALDRLKRNALLRRQGHSLSADVNEEVAKALDEARPALEALDLLLPPEASEAARLVFSQVDDVLSDFRLARSGSYALPDIDDVERAFDLLRRDYVRQVRAIARLDS